MCLFLGDLLDQAVELRGRGLVEPAALLHPEETDPSSNGGADTVDVARCTRRLKRDRDVRLGAEIIDLVRVDVGQQTDKI